MIGKSREEKRGLSKDERKKYGESAHYWPVEVQPFLVAEQERGRITAPPLS